MLAYGEARTGMGVSASEGISLGRWCAMTTMPMYEALRGLNQCLEANNGECTRVRRMSMRFVLGRMSTTVLVSVIRGKVHKEA